MSADCPRCGEPVEDGEWHRPCILVALGAVLVSAAPGDRPTINGP